MFQVRHAQGTDLASSRYHAVCYLSALRSAKSSLQKAWRQESERSLGGKNSRFTLLFEAFAIRVLKAARSVEEARKLLRLNWHQVDAIKARAVERGLARRQEANIDYLGIDEKQFRSGHDYVRISMTLPVDAYSTSSKAEPRMPVSV